MGLSNDLISQFAKLATSDKKQTPTETTVYGTAVIYEGKSYVKIDGSDLLTPVQTTTSANDGDRVTVLIKNHTATITGNSSDPSASSNVVTGLGDKVTEVEGLVADKISVGELDAEKARIDELIANNVTIRGDLDAQSATIENLKTTKLDAEVADITYATIENLKATNADIYNLNATYGEFQVLTTNKFGAVEADIKNLNAGKLSVEDAEVKYANIDFANIGKAAIENFYANSGLIEDIVVGDGTITGNLVGVTIKGDLIEGGTVVADKLVIKGEDGLYYKLNTDGETIESEQTEYNSLDGTHILAKSITATKVNVQDLVAFDATIAGFKITNNAIYSGVKESVENTTRGIYLDNEGQIAFGDASNYIRFFKDENGKYRLAISASSMILSSSNKNIETEIEDIKQTNNKGVKSVDVQYALSDSTTVAPTSGWSTIAPQWEENKYMWQKTVTTLNDGTIIDSEPTCIAGAKGQDGTNGEDAVLLQILSSNGNMFKNTSLSTTLTVEIIVGGLRITSSRDMYMYFGGNAKLTWQQKVFGSTEFTDIDPTDSRISDNGFIFTLNTEDLKLQTVYTCILDC